MADPTYSTVDLSNNIVLGKDCTLNTGGGKLNGVTSVSITCESDEIDVSTRDDNGFAKRHHHDCRTESHHHAAGL